MIDPMILEKLTKILEMAKISPETIAKVKEEADKWTTTDVTVVKVDTLETKLTAQDIDKMSEKELRDALKKEMWCDSKEEAPYKGTPQEQEIRGSRMM